MLGHRRQRHIERFGQLCHGVIMLGQTPQNFPARRVGQGMEDSIKDLRVLLNHMVVCYRPIGRFVNHLVEQ